MIDAKRDMRSINEYPFPIFPVLSVDRLFIRLHRVSATTRSFDAVRERERRDSPLAAAANERQLIVKRSGERSGDIYYYFVGHRRCDLYIEMYFNLNGK